MQTQRIIFIYGLPRAGTTLASRLLLQYLTGGRTVPETWLFVLGHFLHKMRARGFGHKERSLTAALTDIGAMLESDPCRLREIFFSTCPGHTLATRAGDRSDLRYGIEKTPFNIVVWEKLVEKFADDIHIILYRELDEILLSAKAIWWHGWAGYAGALLDLIELYPWYSRLLTQHYVRPGTFFLLRYSSMPEDIEKLIAEISGGAYTRGNRSIAPLPGRLGDPKQAPNFAASSRETIDPISYLELRIYFKYKSAKRVQFDFRTFVRSVPPFVLALCIFGTRSLTKSLLRSK